MSRGRSRVDWGANTEKGKAGAALAQHPDTFEKAERLRKLQSAAMLRDDQGATREERSRAEKCEGAGVFVGGSIGRIEVNNIERRAAWNVFCGEALQSPQCVELQDSRAVAEAEGIQVVLNERGSRRMIFDKDDLGSAAAEGFDADRAGPREKIEEAATGDAFGENVKK